MQRRSQFLLRLIQGWVDVMRHYLHCQIPCNLARNEAKKRNEVFDPHGLKVDNCGSKVWVFGTTVFLSGSLLNFGSYGLAPQSVLACLGTYSCHVKFIPCQSVSTSYAVVVSCFTTAITYDYHDYCLPDL